MHRNAHGHGQKPSPGSGNAVIATSPTLQMVPKTAILDVRGAVQFLAIEAVKLVMTMKTSYTIRVANVVT
jgi:hypothetical protein